MRNLQCVKTKNNSLCYWSNFVNPLRVILNFIIIYSTRFCPSLSIKRILLRLTGMKIGNNSNIGLGVVIDIFNPELIEIGDNCIIGFNSTLLAHEFLIDKYCKGKLIIGDNVMVGANCTILAGIEIGSNSTISAMSLVNRNVKNNSVVGGVPIRNLVKK